MSDQEVVEDGHRICVVGVGGGGGSILNAMIAEGLRGVEFIAMNTDTQDLHGSLAPRRFQLGTTLTKGDGAGADPEVGRRSAEESAQEIGELLDGYSIVFVVAGMGGGTGTGAAPVVARIAREKGALVIGLIATPTDLERRGSRGPRVEAGIETLRPYVHALVQANNEKSFICLGERADCSLYALVDSYFQEIVSGVQDLLYAVSTPNIDFADLRRVLASSGVARIGVGSSPLPSQAEDANLAGLVQAMQEAVSHALVEGPVTTGATVVIANILDSRRDGKSGRELSQALQLLNEALPGEAEILKIGRVLDREEHGQGRVSVLIIAGGFADLT